MKLRPISISYTSLCQSGNYNVTNLKGFIEGILQKNGFGDNFFLNKTKNMLSDDEKKCIQRLIRKY